MRDFVHFKSTRDDLLITTGLSILGGFLILGHTFSPIKNEVVWKVGSFLTFASAYRVMGRVEQINLIMNDYQDVEDASRTKKLWIKAQTPDITFPNPFSFPKQIAICGGTMEQRAHLCEYMLQEHQGTLSLVTEHSVNIRATYTIKPGNSNRADITWRELIDYKKTPMYKNILSVFRSSYAEVADITVFNNPPDPVSHNANTSFIVLLEEDSDSYPTVIRIGSLASANAPEHYIRYWQENNVTPLTINNQMMRMP
jgi:hypothetical protein